MVSYKPYSICKINRNTYTLNRLVCKVQSERSAQQGCQVQVNKKCQTTCKKKSQIISKNTKQSETGWMLLVLILPDEQFAKNTVVLVNKVLIIAYDIKQQTTIIILRKTNTIKPETHSYSFFPLTYIQYFVPEARARTKHVTTYFCLKMLNRK